MIKNRYRPILNNGVLDTTTREQAFADVAWYKKCGYGGFAINGSTAKPIDDVRDWLPGYLQACRYYVDAAKEMDMDVWIFDEWGYPSGCACGQVLTEEKYRAKKLRICYDVILEKGDTLELPVPDKFISAAVFPADYFSFYAPAAQGVRLLPQDGKLRYTAAVRCRVIAVGWEYLTFITHVMKKHTPDDPTIGTIDILSREAVGRFLQYMHEWYVEPLGDEFGKTIHGFFYDEPEISYSFPYTEELSGFFAEKFGYPMEDILPEVLGWVGASGLVNIEDSAPRICREFTDYSTAWTQLLAQNFYGQIRDWCHAHGLLSVGHQDLDNHLQTLRTVSGDFWENNKYNDHPGIDVIWDNIAPDQFNDFPRYAGAAKRTWEKGGAMSETFAEMGPSMYPDRIRYTMEQQLLRGIDQFFLYINHDPEDLNVSHFAAAVNDRVTRTATLLAEGRPGAELGIYVPMDDVAFAASHNDPHLHNSDPQSWQRVDDLARALCYHPLEYDYVWQGTVDTMLRRGLKTLLLPGVQELPEAELDTIKAFIAAGGKAVMIGKPCVALEKIAAFVPSIRSYMHQLPDGMIRPMKGRTVSAAVRCLENETRWFLLNESDEPADAVFADPAQPWKELDAATGEWRVVETACPLHFEPRELKIFALGEALPQQPVRRGEAQQLTEWRFAREGETLRPLAQLVPWTRLGLADHTGFGVYETTFDWQGGALELALGEVRFAAVVLLDDKEYKLPMAPHTLRCTLGAGRHTLRVRVLNSNANRIFSGEDLGRSNFSGGYWQLYQFERDYCDCGLLGPVTVTPLL